jgi:hypothetical protein
MHKTLVLAATLLLTPLPLLAQLPGDTRGSARPLVEEGVPRTAAALALAAPEKKQWIFGSGGSFAENATTLSTSATLSMTGVTRFELRGAYTRRDPEEGSGVDGIGGHIRLFLPDSWTTGRAAVAATAEGRWDIRQATIWAVTAALDMNLSDYVLVGGSVGYNERQPDEGTTASGFVPAVSATAIPVTGTEVRLQYRLDNDFDGEDRTELSVSNRFRLGGSGSVVLRGAIAKHGVVSTSISVFP